MPVSVFCSGVLLLPFFVLVFGCFFLYCFVCVFVVVALLRRCVFWGFGVLLIMVVFPRLYCFRMFCSSFSSLLFFVVGVSVLFVFGVVVFSIVFVAFRVVAFVVLRLFAWHVLCRFSCAFFVWFVSVVVVFGFLCLDVLCFRLSVCLFFQCTVFL